ncbi:MAG: right-handed parallel beta-helix repeat-containing protein [Thermoanaerobaculia bacterium]|nr:right-handed parallel beta-helix repeat-containing protein [Thermoanaerobaculia bacterium]
MMISRQSAQSQIPEETRWPRLVVRPVGRRLGLVAALLCLPTVASAGNIFRVGSGAGCDASTIQQGVILALNEPGTVFVQVSHQATYTENVTISGGSSTDLVILEGGYDSCTSDTPSPVHSVLEASSFGTAALTITQGVEVRVINMAVHSSEGTALAVSTAGTEVVLWNSILSDSQRGGSVQSGAYLEIDPDSVVTNNNNDSPFGGGLYCTGAGTQLDVAGVVENNSASWGAGIHASDGCNLNLFSATIQFNVASANGGGVYVDDGAHLSDSSQPVGNIRDNSATRGGGIYASGADTTVDVDFINIDDNQADFGGGIYASTAAQVTLRGAVNVRENTATNEGGGVAAYGSSVILLRDGFYAQFNNATNGGGFYLASGSHLSGAADGNVGIAIADNQATRGGGLYLTGASTEAVLYNYTVLANEAQTAGGGAFVTSGAYFEMNRGNSIPCADPPRCSQLLGNTLSQGTDGSALLLEAGATAKLYQTYVDFNRHLMPGAMSQVIQTRGTDTTLRLEGIQFWGNDASTLISADDSSAITAGFVTAAENRWSLEGSTVLPKAATTANGGDIFLGSSILVDTDGYDGAIASDCLIIDNATGLVPTGTTSIGIDPQFVDPYNGDLHLQGSSPAIDYCDGAFFFPEDPLDLDLDLRGVDHPEVTGILGWFDLGMDETLSSSALFTDGFESGDTAAWQ